MSYEVTMPGYMGCDNSTVVEARSFHVSIDDGTLFLYKSDWDVSPADDEPIAVFAKGWISLQQV